LVAVPALAAPNNVAIDSENNFTVTDSGTINVPDADRVVFLVHITDQFGNLTSDGSFFNGGNHPDLAKTGPGALYDCIAASSSTDACSDRHLFGTQTTQADGTIDQDYPDVVGSYLNVTSQNRFQADTSDFGDSNGGYGDTTPSVNDGTQTDVLSWAAPTNTFATFIAGSPAVATFASGSATSASDTYTLNFYNQLAQPVVTFSVSPGNKVATSTAVTVTATLVDNHGNPIVGVDEPGVSDSDSGLLQVVRSGANESSCTPVQNLENETLFTNTSGVAGYTFSCDAPGVSNVSMVVTGPGGTQLAQGRESITFTGTAVHTTVERPTVSLTSFNKHHLTVHVATSPALGASRTVNVYRLVNGLKHLVGQTHTGPAGKAALTLSGLRSGAKWRVSAKVINLGVNYRSEYSTAVTKTVK
jgi:hypothetical protein